MRFLTVFSDASFHPSGAGGYAFFIRDETTIIKAGFSVPWQVRSNTELEMFAMCHAILHAVDCLPHDPGDCIVAQTDCTHVIYGFETTTNAGEFEGNMRNSVLSTISSRGLSLRFKHVKAHTGKSDARSYVNRYCDTTAKLHQRLRRQELIRIQHARDIQ